MMDMVAISKTLGVPRRSAERLLESARIKGQQKLFRHGRKWWYDVTPTTLIELHRKRDPEYAIKQQSECLSALERAFGIPKPRIVESDQAAMPQPAKKAAREMVGRVYISPDQKKKLRQIIKDMLLIEDRTYQSIYADLVSMKALQVNRDGKVISGRTISDLVLDVKIELWGPFRERNKKTQSINLFKDGLSIEEIALGLGIERSRVRFILKEAGIIKP